MNTLDQGARRFIADSCRYLERPRFVMRITDLIGRPFEYAVEALPSATKARVSEATKSALQVALQGAISTLSDTPDSFEFSKARSASTQSRLSHNTACALLGAAGGFFGGWALIAELPISTTMMLRSIARTAKAYGYSLHDPDLKMEILSVFSMGSPSPADDAAESAYYMERIALQRLIAESSQYLAGKTGAEVAEALAKKSAPALVRLLARVAERFEITVSEKALAQAMPVVGAVGGSAINLLFADHFGQIATYHFGLKRLERDFGRDLVRAEYEDVRMGLLKRIS